MERHPVRDAWRLMIVGLAATIVVGAYAAFRVWQQGELDERRPADAIVVLGAAQYNGHPSPVLRARLDHAVELFRAGLAPFLVVTGGVALGDRETEAEVARAYAIARGVPGPSILVENTGRTTLESLTSVARILRDHGLTSAVFVSDRTHMLRVLRIATDLGIQGWTSPTTTSPTEATWDARLDAMAHEVGALGLYFVSGGDRLLLEGR